MQRPQQCLFCPSTALHTHPGVWRGIPRATEGCDHQHDFGTYPAAKRKESPGGGKTISGETQQLSPCVLGRSLGQLLRPCKETQRLESLLVRCIHLPALGQDADTSDSHLPTGWPFLTNLSNTCRHFSHPEPFVQPASGGHGNTQPISPPWKASSVNTSLSLTQGKVRTMTRMKSLVWFERPTRKEKVSDEQQTHQPPGRIPSDGVF